MSRRSALHRFLPAHFQNPAGLALRLFRTGDPHARFAMGSAAAGMALTPLDLAMQPFERRRISQATAPELPLLFVCGPPRSGTTLLFQLLVAHLPVGYFSNLTSIFPRSPITATAWFGRRLRYRPADYRSYYGRARSLAAPNDALYLWDRWMGSDRTERPERLGPGIVDSMRRFFGAYETVTEKPLVAKNNNLNASADLVGQVLPGARFICLTRDPLFLAQTLLIARRDIHGDERVPYGLAQGGADDLVSDVILQVRFHQQLLEAQQEKVGRSRFEVLSYEALCADPRAIIRTIADQLGVPLRPEGSAPARFEVSRKVRIEPGLIDRLKAEL